MYIYAVVDTVTVHYGLIHSTGAINCVKLKIEHMVLLEKLNHLEVQYCCKVYIKKLVQEIKSLLDSTPNGRIPWYRGKNVRNVMWISDKNKVDVSGTWSYFRSL